MGLKDLLWHANSHHPCGPSAIHTSQTNMYMNTFRNTNTYKYMVQVTLTLPSSGNRRGSQLAIHHLLVWPSMLMLHNICAVGVTSFLEEC